MGRTHETGATTPLASAARVLLLMVLLSSGCASAAAQAPPHTGLMIPVRALHHYYGLTVWDCSEPDPAAFVSLRLLGNPVDLRLTIVHELNHVAVMRSFGSCERWAKWAQNNRPMFEAMAFCAASQEAERVGYGFENAIKSYAPKLAMKYPFGLTVEQADSLIRGACNDPIFRAATRAGGRS